MKTIHLFFIFTLSIYKIVFSQSELLKQLNKSDSLFENENYFDAITEYKRFLFFNSNSDTNAIANLKIAKSYKYGGYYENAITYFHKAEQKSNATLRFNAQIEIVKCYLLLHQADIALKQLEYLENFAKFADTKEEIFYWRGWCKIFLGDWENASKEFESISKNHFLANFCNETARKTYSAQKAKLLSLLIPGLGQIYTGNYLSGLLSLGWSALFGIMTFNSLMAEEYLNGLLVANFLFSRFYFGNLENAVKFADEKNLLILNEALQFLQNDFKGQKP